MDGALGFNKEAIAEVPKTCILLFAQQEPPKLVAKRLSTEKSPKFILFYNLNIFLLVLTVKKGANMALCLFCLIWSNFEKKCSVAYILQTTLSFTWLKTWGSREAGQQQWG